MKKHPFHLIEKHRTYTTTELADRLKVHPRTIQEWCKEGLPCMNESKPHLFKGEEIKMYLKRKRKQEKVKLKQGEFYCMKCRQAVKAIEGSQTIKEGKNMGRYTQYLIKGICEKCGSKINRVSSSKRMKIGA